MCSINSLDPYKYIKWDIAAGFFSGKPRGAVGCVPGTEEHECHKKVVSYELYFLVFDMCHFENRRLTSALTEINNHPVGFRNCEAGPSQRQ